MTNNLNRLMSKVFGYMTAGLCITGLVAYLASTIPALTAICMTIPAIIVIAVSEIGLVYWMSSRYEDMSFSRLLTCYIAFALINGLLFSSIFLCCSMSSIAYVFVVTAATFAVMALTGLTTDRDLTSLGGILFFGLVGLIIASIANMFFCNETFGLAVSYAAVIIFVGLTAYDAQQIKDGLARASSNTEHAEKFALIGAVELYLDFYNLFIHLLRILGDRN